MDPEGHRLDRHNHTVGKFAGGLLCALMYRFQTPAHTEPEECDKMCR